MKQVSQNLINKAKGLTETDNRYNHVVQNAVNTLLENHNEEFSELILRDDLYIEVLEEKINEISDSDDFIEVHKKFM